MHSAHAYTHTHIHELIMWQMSVGCVMLIDLVFLFILIFFCRPIIIITIINSTKDTIIIDIFITHAT